MRAAWAMIAATVLAAGCDTALNHLIGLAGSGSGATHLVFTVQPSNTTASLVINPAVVVVAQNASGNADTTYTNSVTVALGANPGSGTLSGIIGTTSGSVTKSGSGTWMLTGVFQPCRHACGTRFRLAIVIGFQRWEGQAKLHRGRNG